jgi:DNA-binding transcriptional regulator YiaG
MINKTENDVCPICAEGRVSELLDMEYRFSFDGVTHAISDLAHLVCDHCGTSMCNSRQLRANSKKVRDYQATIEGYISPSRILSIREIFLITREDANALFADSEIVNEEPLYSQWEEGRASPSRDQASILNKAFHDKEYMFELSKRKGVSVTMPDVSGSAALARF